MRLMLSGEGPSDLGCERSIAEGKQFAPGPMAWMVDKILERCHTGYSLLETYQGGGDCVTYVSEKELTSVGKRRSPMGKRGALLPGVRFGKETAYFVRNAQTLGLLAKQKSEQEDRPVLAVLFRDGDGTQAMSMQVWQQKVDSMHRGFALVKCKTGVPMVPRPKSEAWLLCALRQPNYTNCESLEDASGNDASPNSLKKQLAARCGGADPSADEQAEWVANGAVDPLRIDMPSFNAFKQALHQAAHKAGLPNLP